MITLEQAEPGTEIIFDDVRSTTILAGSWEDPAGVIMIKTALYPQGMSADHFTFPGAEQAIQQEVEALPAIIFEGVILDEKEPVKFTPELIRQKSKALLDLTIKDIFDEAGLKAVKSARMKIVKTRTAIESIEKAEKGKLKVKHDAEKKELTDYAATLYEACKEGEDALQLKITAHETDKAAAAKKLADDLKEKTEGRNTKMYELGMKFNGTGFMEYGKYIGQDVLHAMSDEKYAELLVEIEGLSMEQGVTGTAPAPVSPVDRSNLIGCGFGFGSKPTKGNGGFTQEVLTGGKITTYDINKADRVYTTAIYERAIAELGVRIIITSGVIEPEADALVSNDRIKESSYYLQIVR